MRDSAFALRFLVSEHRHVDMEAYKRTYQKCDARTHVECHRHVPKTFRALFDDTLTESNNPELDGRFLRIRCRVRRLHIGTQRKKDLKFIITCKQACFKHTLGKESDLQSP